MTKLAYYNENDPKAALVLKQMIVDGLIAPGDVDDRSIVDVQPGDLDGYRQWHMFAGVGGWSIALRKAGWPDDRPVWTGSCPCQPFSCAGAKKGKADARHLWPEFYRLIKARTPEFVFGEQVASKDGLAWFDDVQTDLDGSGYTVGCVDTCAAGFGAPHIRQRLYWSATRSADTTCRPTTLQWQPRQSAQSQFPTGRHGISMPMADAGSTGLEVDSQQHARDECEAVERSGEAVGLPNTKSDRCGEECQDAERSPNGDPAQRISAGFKSSGSDGATNGHWRDAEWIYCRDDKWRPVKPGIAVLAHGVPNRIPKLRGLGNAIVIPQAQAFIESVMESVS